MSHPGSEFKNLLHTEFLRRCRSNPRYSLRAFARYLSIDPSTLSQIFRGKRPITKRFAESRSTRLGLSEAERAKLLAAYESPGTTGSARGVATHELSIDTFHVIAEWYHLAIYALASVKGFDSSSEYVAKKLGISKKETKLAIERLLRLGLFVRDSEDRLKQGTTMLTTTGNPFTDRALKALQTQFLDQAKAALENTPIEKRDQSTITFSLHSSRIPEVKDRIKKFRRQIMAYVEKDSSHDVVYTMGVSLFPLTRD